MTAQEAVATALREAFEVVPFTAENVIDYIRARVGRMMDSDCGWCHGKGWYWFDPGPEWGNDECRRYCWDCDVSNRRRDFRLDEPTSATGADDGQ